MNSPAPLADLLRRVRAGEQEAITDFYRDYEPAVRRTARAFLNHSHIKNHVQSGEIYQSVMAVFFLRVALGYYTLETADDVRKLLRKMARNKFLDRHDRHTAEMRDVRRDQPGGEEQAEYQQTADPSPSSVVANRELIELCLGKFTAEEREVVEQRASGRSWEDLAAERQITAAALRMRHCRAVNRAIAELGLDASDL